MEIAGALLRFLELKGPKLTVLLCLIFVRTSLVDPIRGRERSQLPRRSQGVTFRLAICSTQRRGLMIYFPSTLCLVKMWTANLWQTGVVLGQQVENEIRTRSRFRV